MKKRPVVYKKGGKAAKKNQAAIIDLLKMSMPLGYF
jgi:hypothetical protein